jgi:N-methylhydantoinase B/oxoprolinase/acetone carboxylase alpha subunit
MALDTALNAQITDAVPTTVNPQITDAVTRANTQSPAVALGTLYQATAQALANAAHNATTAQQNANTILQATTTQGVAMLYGVVGSELGVRGDK